MNVTHILAASALLALAGCATDDAATQTAEADTVDPRRGEQIDRLCFAHNIDGFGETTRNSVVVSEGLDQYLVETFPGCFDLDDAQSLAIDSTLSCLTRGDRITGFDSVFGPDNIGPRSYACTVKAIYEWDSDAEAAPETEEAKTNLPEAEPT